MYGTSIELQLLDGVQEIVTITVFLSRCTLSTRPKKSVGYGARLFENCEASCVPQSLGRIERPKTFWMLAMSGLD